MELSKQVCSLKLAKKLKELGVEQLGLFSWYKVKERFGDGIKIEVINNMYADDVCGDGVEVVCSAFTVAELGEMLKKYDIDYWYSYPDFRLKLQKLVDTQGRDENEANARTKMLVYLLENKLLKIKKGKNEKHKGGKEGGI